MHQQVNKKIITRLNQRGFKNIRTSNTRKLVLKFEHIPRSQEIFETINDRPLLRALMQLLMHEKLPVTKDQVQQVLEKNREHLRRTLKESPDKNLICRNCSEIIHRYSIYEENRPSWRIKCPKCNTPNVLNQCTEEDDWSFPVISVTSYLDKLIEIATLTSSVLGNCARCMRSEVFQPVTPRRYGSFGLKHFKRYLKKLHCEECGRLYDLMEIYNFEDDIMPLWAKDEGIWLEWYIKNLIKKHFPSCPIEQGLIVSNEESVQVDAMLMKDEKIFSFECKALSPRKKASFKEVSDVLKLLDFSDEVLLVTTTTLKENDKRLLLKTGRSKLEVVEGPEIEHIKRFIEH